MMPLLRRFGRRRPHAVTPILGVGVACALVVSAVLPTSALFQGAGSISANTIASAATFTRQDQPANSTTTSSATITWTGQPGASYEVYRCLATNPSNLAKNATVTAASGGPFNGSMSLVTDGDTTSNANTYVYSGSSPAAVQVDLGSPVNMDSIRTWHYWYDGRVYNGTKTEVSADGTTWTTVFDSATTGTYSETAQGHLVSFTRQQVRYIRDWLSGNNINGLNAWIDVQAFDSNQAQCSFGITPIATPAAGTTSYIDTSLAASTSYRYAVKAITSKSSTTIGTWLAWTQPAVPTGLTINRVGQTDADFTWTAVQGAQGTGYRLYRDGSPVSGVIYATSWTDSTYLNPAEAHTWTIRAVNPAYESADSNSVSATMLPATPTNLRANGAATTTTVPLAWDAGTGSNTYDVLRCAGSGCTAFAIIASGLASTPTTYTDSTVQPGTAYRYAVRGCNVTGCTPLSTAYAATTTLDPPFNLAVTGRTTSSIDLSWTAPAGATSYQVFRNGTQVGTATGTTYTDSGLSAGGSWNYTVAAATADTTSVQTAAVVGRTLTVAPTLSASTTAGTQTVSLSWSAVTGASSYNVYRSGTNTLVCQTTATTACNDTGLARGQVYSYEVVAFNADGFGSARSNTASATVIAAPAAPTAVTVTGIGSSTVNLSWTAPASPATAPVSTYNVYVNNGASPAVTVTGTTATVTGLARLTDYTFQVSAANAAGESTRVAANRDATPAKIIVVEDEGAKNGLPNQCGVGGIAGDINQAGWTDVTVNTSASSTTGYDVVVADGCVWSFTSTLPKSAFAAGQRVLTAGNDTIDTNVLPLITTTVQLYGSGVDWCFNPNAAGMNALTPVFPSYTGGIQVHDTGYGPTGIAAGVQVLGTCTYNGTTWDSLIGQRSGNGRWVHGSVFWGTNAANTILAAMKWLTSP